MKKLLLLLVTFIAGITAYGQDEGIIKLTLNVDNPERVSIAIFGEPLEGLKEGDNELEVSPWTNIEISAAKGCTLKSVVNSAGESIAISSNTATILLTDEKTEETLTITSEKEGEVAFTIEVDKPSEVSVLDCNYKNISLSEGVNEISMPQSELPLIIGSVNYGQDLYSVTLDDVEQTFNYGYSVMPKDGSKIVIIAEFPEKDCKGDKFLHNKRCSFFFESGTASAGMERCSLIIAFSRLKSYRLQKLTVAFRAFCRKSACFPAQKAAFVVYWYSLEGTAHLL